MLQFSVRTHKSYCKGFRITNWLISIIRLFACFKVEINWTFDLGTDLEGYLYICCWTDLAKFYFFQTQNLSILLKQIHIQLRTVAFPDF